MFSPHPALRATLPAKGEGRLNAPNFSLPLRGEGASR